jgi:RNase P subunit RPR2
MSNAASDQIYCLKCREKTDTLEAQEVVLKNGRPAVTGQCTTCGTKKFRMSAARK